MTYLATEMLLYLLSAVIVSLALGWLIWGVGHRRKLDALHDDLMAMIEAERVAHRETKRALNDADARLMGAVEATKADANRSITELRRTLDAESLAAEEAQTALERMRLDMENALLEGRVSGQEAVDQAMKTANAEKATAAEAMASEAQLRAQIEELRLLIGAEKLAAESARTELENLRADTQAELGSERAAHETARVALDDIRATLARTLGSTILDITASDGDASMAASSLRSGERRGHDRDGLDGTTVPATTGSSSAPPFNMMTDMAAAGEALNNPDLDEADIEDREDVSLDLSATIETEQDLDKAPALDLKVHEPNEVVDPAPPLMPDRIELKPLPIEPLKRKPPATFLDRRPGRVDDLTAIHGISPEIERQLQHCGCHRYSQLAELTAEDIDWLVQETNVTAYRIAADRWVEQAKSLQRHTSADTDRDTASVDGTDRQNAAS